MSPTDEHAYFDTPPMFPKYDEVHISVTFTWDIERGIWLKKQWEGVCDVVKIGGVAFEAMGGDFVGNRYLKDGCVITSRGCPNRCSFCMVPDREGKLRELPIVEGNNIMDNNLTACSKPHIDKVFSMLEKQRQIKFSGGIEARRITDYFIEQLRGIRLERLYLAFDNALSEKPLIKAVNKLKKYFRREMLGCFVLIGWDENGTETIEKARARLVRAWEIGVMPYAMLYQPRNFIKYSREWKRFQRSWILPPIIKAMMKKV